MTFNIASNGTIHVDGCEHANRVRTLSGDYATIAEAREIAHQDFNQIRVAPCARKVEPTKRTTLKVLVQLTVEVDVEDYRLNYGADDIATIRNDVKSAIASAVTDGSILASGLVGVKSW